MENEKEIEIKIKKLLEKYDEEYNILCLFDEDELRKKFIELKFDEEKIRVWLEEKLSE